MKTTKKFTEKDVEVTQEALLKLKKEIEDFRAEMSAEIIAFTAVLEAKMKERAISLK